jgi:quinohemoprotein ethanol dehydrogenase
LVVFALGAHGTLHIVPPSAPEEPLDDASLSIDTGAATAGNALFNSSCHLCHGFMAVSGGVAPDLRASSLALHYDGFAQVVKGGLLEQRGMPRFAELSDAEVRSLYWYVRERARADAERAKVAVR